MDCFYRNDRFFILMDRGKAVAGGQPGNHATVAKMMPID
jgi:hypothetical protein